MTFVALHSYKFGFEDGLMPKKGPKEVSQWFYS